MLGKETMVQRMAFQEKENDIGNKSVMEFKTAILYVKKCVKILKNST